tara:strand:+ start:273 stop:677 length:405 start_codon:yes stop_codon:yes gene_type:complete
MILRAIKELLSSKEIDETKIECAVDEERVPCDTLEDVFFSPEAQGSWTGIPAPRVLEDDPWFGPAVVSDANRDYMEQETSIKQQEYQETHQSVEPENIHQVMYEMATQNSATTLQLDPIGGSENFQGGSENIHR